MDDVPEHQRAAYELELLDNPEELRKVLANDDFFQMIAGFPEAWWGERMSMYLYRHEDDGGLMIKNAEGEGNYIKPIIRRAVDRDWVAKYNGGGKYRLWLNLSDPANSRKSTTLRKYTFRIDGPPLLKDGQVVEIHGKPVSLGAQTPPAAPQNSEAAQLMESSSKATDAAVNIMERGMTNVMELQNKIVERAAGLAPNPEAGSMSKMMEILLQRVMNPPAAPAADPVQAKLMEKIIDKAFATPEAVEPERRETPTEEAIATVERITGKSVADLFKSKAAPESEYAWVGPLANFGLQLITQAPTILRELRAGKEEEFRRTLYMRGITNTPGEPAQLTAPPRANIQQPPSPPNDTTTNVAPQPPDKPQVVRTILARIIHGFNRHRDTGDDIAAAICVEFGEYIEAMGLEPALTQPKQMEAELAHHLDLAGALAQCTTHAKWGEFESAFLDYMHERYQQPEGDEGEAEKKGPQPAA
jgi:hypothetical protein